MPLEAIDPDRCLQLERRPWDTIIFSPNIDAIVNPNRGTIEMAINRSSNPALHPTTSRAHILEQNMAIVNTVAIINRTGAVQSRVIGLTKFGAGHEITTSAGGDKPPLRGEMLALVAPC